MNKELSNFAARLRASIVSGFQKESFEPLALGLFALQFQNNSAYRKICEVRNRTPQNVEHWTQIPFVPTSVFKELELTSLAPSERIAVFHSSGTTEQKPSRHFHCAESLALYEMSLWEWFERNTFENSESRIQNPELICLTSNSSQAPNSSLVHMFETIRRKVGAPENVFVGKTSINGWTLDFDATLSALQSTINCQSSTLILGTAFSFVHFLDFLAEKKLKFQLPESSFVMETGGYKNRSRTMLKAELHSLIEKFLGIPRENIICEYGMSELSSQAYQTHHSSLITHHFAFSPWARAQIISPETGREVHDGETGLIRIFDLANVFSVAAIQTEDLGVKHDEHFDLIGRAQLAEPRGCSLMTA
ncbi:MAG TPA: hypothetical protein VHG71_10970 [Verrucomicrobiae bacterium]|nr:hypothetical protein [Verrucomicrobiae bacterium]